MGLNRKPFQGVVNIVKFNWHFYLVAAIALVLAMFLMDKLPSCLRWWVCIGVFVALAMVLSSLIFSYYIYDKSDLYSLPWMKEINADQSCKILNVSAGFDEVSLYLSTLFPESKLIMCDFYNSNDHTEISIERARKLYPSHHSTIKVISSKLPFEDGEFKLVNVFMAAHEVRDQEERILFFKELYRVTNINGKVIITEHLRDFNNFLAFSFGFFHFYSKSSWNMIFRKTNLKIQDEIKTTPFVTTFILSPDGVAD